MTEPFHQQAPPATAELVPAAVPDLREEVVQVLRNSLEQVIGPDAMAVLHVTPETRLFKDLGLDSIELMQVAEKVQNHYGVDAGYVMERASEIPVRKMMKLTVGDLVELITEGLR